MEYALFTLITIAPLYILFFLATITTLNFIKLEENANDFIPVKMDLGLQGFFGFIPIVALIAAIQLFVTILCLKLRNSLLASILSGFIGMIIIGPVLAFLAASMDNRATNPFYWVPILCCSGIVYFVAIAVTTKLYIKASYRNYYV